MTILVVISYILVAIGIIDTAGAKFFSTRKVLGLSKKQHRMLGGFMALIGLIGTQFIPWIEGEIKERTKEQQEALATKQDAHYGSINTLFVDLNRPVTIYCGGGFPMECPANEIHNLNFAPFAITEDGGFAFGENINTTSYKPIIIKYKDKSLKIDAELRSFDQKIIARIHENEWQLNQGNYFDRNYDESGLEIIDIYGITQLQINIIDGNQIYIGGTFIKDDKYAILTYNRVILHDTKFTLNDIIDESEKKIPKIFRYPSGLHLGQRVLR